MTDPTTDPIPVPAPALAPPAPPGLASVRGRWAAPPVPPRPLATVRLGDDATLVVPFTDRAASANRHYVKSDVGNEYVRCTGPGCLLCALRKEAQGVSLLPVYVPADAAVAVLSVGDSLRPGALGAQLGPLLDRVMAGEQLVVEVRRKRDYTYEVSAFTLPPGADDGAAAIGRFKVDLDAGRVKLEDVYPVRSRAELLNVPELGREAAMRGIGS
ncbi:MAG TPA: hypothetical protein VH092_20585 [Urbifossiella sp.]|jgi:hypothetical protein|nr:hypothetical protein [Urbifossiella sp.]